MSSYTASGVDLDTIFEPWQTGDPKISADDKYADSGVLRRDVYAPLSLGAKCPADVKYKVGEIDFRDLFAAIGSVPRFGTIPWDKTIAPAAFPVYRQPSRNLATQVQINCTVQQDGRYVLRTESPNVHSNPAVVNAVVDQGTVWDNSKVPTGVDFEIRFDVVSGSGVTVDAGLGLGTWIRLTSSHAGATARITLGYNHSAQVSNLYALDAQLRISLRRTDYPTTNTTTGVLIAALQLNVLDSLFSDVNTWGNRTVLAQNTATGNYHNPDANTANFTAAVETRIKLDGTIVQRRSIAGGAWVETLNTRWRRDEASVANTDYEVRRTTVSGSGGTPATNLTEGVWVKVTATEGYFTFTQTTGNSTAPGVHSTQSVQRFEFRQVSTKGYVQNSITLADNFVSADITHRNEITVQQPQSLPWPDLTPWDGVYNRSKTANLNPDAPFTLQEFVKVSFTAAGDVVVTSDGVTLATGRWLPAGSTNAQVELQATLSESGSSPVAAVNQLASWTTVTSGEKYLLCSASQVHAIGGVVKRLVGVVNLRRKSYPSDLVSVNIDLNAAATITAPVAYPWPDSSSWGKVWNYTESQKLNPEAPFDLSGFLRVTVFSTGTLTVSDEYGNKVSATWLPSGIANTKVEIMAAFSGSGNTGTDTNTIGTGYATLTSGSKYVEVALSRPHASNVGTSTRRLVGTISFRRANYPSEIFTVNVDLNLGLTWEAPIAYVWPSTTNWAKTHRADVADKFKPEAPTDLSEWIHCILKTNGDLLVEESSGVITTARWLPAGVSSSEVEAYANVANTGDAGATHVNQLSGWTQMTTQDKKFSANITRAGASGVGASQAAANGTLQLRRKALTSDGVSGSINLLAVATMTAPDAWPWPSTAAWATTHSTSVSTALLPESSASYGRDITAKFYGNGTVTVEKDGSVVATGKWHPGGAAYDAYAEIRANATSSTVNGGSVSNGVGTAFTQIASNGFKEIRCTATLMHNAGVGTASLDVTFNIEARRKNYPAETVSNSIRITVAVALTAPAAPDWSGINFPTMNQTTVAPQDLTGAAPNLVATTKWDLGTTAVGTNSWSGNGDAYTSGSSELHRFSMIPPGFAAGDFEYMYQELSGGNPVIGALPGGDTFYPLTTAKSVTNTVSRASNANPGISSNPRTLRITIRRVKFPAHYVERNAVQNVIAQTGQPLLTLWPRPDYQKWAGTYSHNMSVVQIIPKPQWAKGFAGTSRGVSADWQFLFNTNGTYEWGQLSGLGPPTHTGGEVGVWMGGSVNAANYSIRYTSIKTIASYSSNITTAWQKMSTVRKISLGAGLPPQGEPDNTNWVQMTLEIRDDSTGVVVATGVIDVEVYSLR